jgi:NAD(P)-dependent dehydrogenase (short-subunit alcohol dehydrogenase family)
MTMKGTKTLELDASLRGKVAVVTGAARGIGRATAIAIARAGADLVGIDICASVDPRSGVEPANPDDLKETGRLVEAAGRGWLGFVLDQRDPPALRAAAAEAQRELGVIDILFANAGEPPLVPRRANCGGAYGKFHG